MKINGYYLLKAIAYIIFIACNICGFILWFTGTEINAHSIAPALPIFGTAFLVGVNLFGDGD